jgi:geranylgeranyl pyrophosphate synthase
VSRERKDLGGDCTADILNKLSDAHLKLSEGQGAELLWRDARDKTLTALDALKIYALKTAPAFEAALYAGLRLAGPADHYEKTVADFSKNLGVAFQILNDLKDWDGDDDNKLIAGQDVLAARPTLLLALALEGSAAAEREELLALLRRSSDEGSVGAASRAAPDGPARLAGPTLEQVRQLFTNAQVFVKTEKLVEKYRARAEAIADEMQPTELRELLYYLVDSVLDRPSAATEPAVPPLIQLSV